MVQRGCDMRGRRSEGLRRARKTRARRPGPKGIGAGAPCARGTRPTNTTAQTTKQCACHASNAQGGRQTTAFRAPRSDNSPMPHSRGLPARVYSQILRNRRPITCHTDEEDEGRKVGGEWSADLVKSPRAADATWYLSVLAPPPPAKPPTRGHLCDRRHAGTAPQPAAARVPCLDLDEGLARARGPAPVPGNVGCERTLLR